MLPPQLPSVLAVKLPGGDAAELRNSSFFRCKVNSVSSVGNASTFPIACGFQYTKSLNHERVQSALLCLLREGQTPLLTDRLHV